MDGWDGVVEIPIWLGYSTSMLFCYNAILSPCSLILLLLVAWFSRGERRVVGQVSMVRVGCVGSGPALRCDLNLYLEG